MAIRLALLKRPVNRLVIQHERRLFAQVSVRMLSMSNNNFPHDENPGNGKPKTLADISSTIPNTEGKVSDVALVKPKVLAFLIQNQPLLEGWMAKLKGDLDMLKSILKSIRQGVHPVHVSVFYSPTSEFSEHGSLCNVSRLTIKSDDTSIIVVDEKDKGFSLLYNNYPQTDYSVIDKFLEGIEGTDKTVTWDCDVQAQYFIKRNSQVSSQQVEYGPQNIALPTQPEEKQEFDSNWRTLCAYLRDMKLLNRGELNPTRWKALCCHLLSHVHKMSGPDLQKLVECESAVEGVKLTIKLLHREQHMLETLQSVGQKIYSDNAKQSEKSMKMEVIKRMQKDLGQDQSTLYRERLNKYDQGVDHEKLNEKRKKEEEKEEEFWKSQLEAGGSPLSLPPKVRKIVEDELIKLDSLSGMQSEHAHTKNYLDWLTTIPWGRTTVDTYDLTQAEKILNQDHYGLDDVKKRILEIVAIAKLKSSPDQKIQAGKIICLVGPPGVGKTSIGKSIASSLGRKFYRFSVGGMHDVSELKGHRRTYVNSMPGKLVQMFRSVGCVNPVMMIDEVDKLPRSSSYAHGDFSAALLELLDPSQNSAFLDQYLDVPIDASKVLFICTANSLETIRGPLLDRLEVIEVPGYDNYEKVKIAKNFLDPKLREQNGLSLELFPGLSDNAISVLSKNYAREAGVRKLEKLMDKIYRAVVMDVVKTGKPIAEIQETDLPKYLGEEVHSDRIFGETTPIGVVMGLAYDPYGGRALYIEATSKSSSKEGRGSITSTGNLGETMKESVHLAAMNARRECGGSFFDENQVSLHVPFGGVSKDGPSAGIAMTVALMSLGLNTPTDPYLAMTGEITLTGRVLPVGGIKQKVLSANRAGVKTLILPELNRKDWLDLSEQVRKDISIHFVKDIKEVIAIAFPSHTFSEVPTGKIFPVGNSSHEASPSL